VSLQWDGRGLREHRELVARLQRCVSCGVPIACPTSTSECIYCRRRADPNGKTLAAWPKRDPGPTPEAVDAEGSPVVG